MKVRPLLILLLFVVSTGILVWIYFAALRGQRAPHRRQWTETLADLDACCRQKHIKSKQYDHFAETARAEQRPGAEQLFRAMAFSARLHEYNCANAIVRLGGRYTPPEKVTVFRGTTDQNLQRSIDYERRTPDALHAGEIDRALAAGNRYAARVLIWSKAGDVRHRALMARYIATGETGHEAGYRICPRLREYLCSGILRPVLSAMPDRPGRPHRGVIQALIRPVASCIWGGADMPRRPTAADGTGDGIGG